MADPAPGATTMNPAPRGHAVTVPIRRCFGVDVARGADETAVSVVLQRADGGLVVLAMSYATAVAMALAIRNDIKAPPLGAADPT